jgi:hypothetical protein
VVENPLAPADPALRVVLGLGLPEPLVGHLFARSPERSRQDEPGGRFAVVFLERWDDALLATLRPAPPRAEKLALTIEGRTLEHPGQTGATWQLPGFSLRVARVFPDFAIRKGPDGEPEACTLSLVPREPWAQLDLVQAGGATARLLLSARNPAVSDRLNAASLPPGVTLRYLREGEETQGRFVVFTAQDQRVRLLEAGRVVRSEPMELLRPFIVARGLSVTPEALMPHAEPVFAANPEPARPLAVPRPVLQVGVTGPGGGTREERWLEAGGPGRPAREATFAGGLALSYRDPLPDPALCRSELVLLDARDRELARQVVGPGAPLTFRGLAFHQTPDDSGGPDASTILLVREPGLWLVWAGFASLLAGCAWMFYLKPVLKRRAEQS